MYQGKHLHFSANSQPPRFISGFTLLELMIAVLISTAVIAATLALYVRSLEAAAYLNAASRVQENGRFATDHMARTMRMARYDDVTTTGVLPVTPALIGKTTAQALGITGKTPKPSTDAIQISYEGDPGVVNCQGVEFVSMHSDVNLWTTNTYAVSSNDELICQTQDSSGNVGNASVIAEGVEDIDLLYGVDTDADGVANRYVHQDGVSNWSLVVSAKISLLVNSVDTVWRGTIHFCESCDIFTPVANDLLRAEFHTTVRFRNS